MADEQVVTEQTPESVDSVDELKAMVSAQTSQIDALTKTVDTTVTRINELASKPVYKGLTPSMLHGAAPYVTTGPLGERGYSFLRATKFALGYCSADQAKEEVQLSNKLAKMYAGYHNWTQHGSGAMLIPLSSALMPQDSTEFEATARECREKVLAGVAFVDPDEMRWIEKRLTSKSLGTISDLAGGALVGAPQLSGELIELQRNREVFPQIGAREIALPPNGRIQFPKQTGGATAYWVGEGANVSPSDPATGSLTLEAKKLAVLTKVNNELFRFANPAAEALLREDQARVAALRMDLAMLEGTGGTSIKGIITYSDVGTYTARVTGSNGDTFQPSDVLGMEAKLPDAVDGFTAYVMHRRMANALLSWQADAASAGDRAGPFLFDITRTAGMGPSRELAGAKLVRSNQVSLTRTKGGSSSLTYILGCYGPDWIIARMGVGELLMANQGDTALVSDQTWVRFVQHVDAGPRHAASFVFCDQLVVS